MLVSGPDRLLRLPERRVRERSYCYANQIRHSFWIPEHGRSAVRTKMEGHRLSGDRVAGEGLCNSLMDADGVAFEEGADTKQTSGAALAFETVTDRDPPGSPLQRSCNSPHVQMAIRSVIGTPILKIRVRCVPCDRPGVIVPIEQRHRFNDKFFAARLTGPAAAVHIFHRVDTTRCLRPFRVR